MLTKKETLEYHKELWDWLYHNPSKRKRHWPGWEVNGGPHKDRHLNECFLCDYVVENLEHGCITGEECLLNWGEGISCLDSYFRDWDCAKSPYYRKKYAKIIRDLPVRK